MKRIVSLVCLICLLFSLSVYADTTVIVFSDVSNSHWAKSYIDTFVQNGVVSGYTDGTFKPENNVTREEFCKLLVKTFDADGSYTSSKIQTFADVEPNRWSYNDVEICRDFLTGYMNPFGGKPLFKPTDAATREDIAVALVKMLGYKENDVEGYGEYVNKFKDSQSISPNLKNYIGFATSKGLINGYPNGSFGAQNGITRAETLVMLDRTLKVSIDDEYEKFEFDVKMTQSGNAVNFLILSNYRLRVLVNGEEVYLAEGGGYDKKFSRHYSYYFEEEGKKEFVVEATYGKVTKKETFVAEYSIGKPKIEFYECPTEVKTSNVTIKGKVTCEGATNYDIDFRINGSKVGLSNNEFSYGFNFYDETVKTIVFEAEFMGRKTKVEKEIEYVIEAPEIEIYSCPKEVKINKATISGSVSDSNYKGSSLYSYVSLMINNQKVNIDSRGLFTTEITLEEGENDIVIIAKNDKGKTTKVRKTIEYIVEKEDVEEEVKEEKNEEIKEEEEVKEYSAPILTIINYPEITEDSGIYISGQVIDKNVEDIRDILVSVNGDKAFVDDKGFWKDFVILNDGVNKIKVTATNEFGKTSEETIEITKN